MQNNRLHFLDGIRGWGALMVYFLHLSPLYIPPGKFPYIDAILYRTPLKILIDGQLAIFLFFIVSGFALSYSFFKKSGDMNYLKEAAQFRYFRLFVPVLLALLLPYFLTKYHLMFNVHAYFGVYSRHVHFYEVLRYALVELPFIYQAPHGLHNLVLWTVYLEFIASMLIFAFLALFGTWHLRFLLYPIMAALFYCLYSGSLYFLFFVGVVIADLYCQQQKGDHLRFSLTSKQKNALTITSIIVLIGIYWRGIVSHHHLILNINNRYVFATLLFILTLYLPVFNDFYSNKFSKFLGRISFSVYLLHLPIFCSVSCFLYDSLDKTNYPLVLLFLFEILITTFITVGLSYIFTRFIEENILTYIKSSLRKVSKISLLEHLNLFLRKLDTSHRIKN